jgi:predicted Rossmann fold nucleotide-binding protein DprA/Smf involved in DNA uptake
VRRLGSPSAVLHAGHDELVAAGAPAKVAAAIRSGGGRAARELDTVRALGGRVVVRTGGGLPALLAEIPDPPLALMLRGTLTPEPYVAIAGRAVRASTVAASRSRSRAIWRAPA